MGRVGLIVVVDIIEVEYVYVVGGLFVQLGQVVVQWVGVEYVYDDGEFVFYGQVVEVFGGVGDVDLVGKVVDYVGENFVMNFLLVVGFVDEIGGWFVWCVWVVLYFWLVEDCQGSVGQVFVVCFDQVELVWFVFVEFVVFGVEVWWDGDLVIEGEDVFM